MGVGIALAAVVAGLALAGPGTVAVSSEQISCRGDSVRAFVGGRVRCLVAGQSCVRRLDTVYHRARFHCHGTRLIRDEWAPLYRKLRVPRLDPGAACPAAGPDPGGDLTRWGFSGTAWGRGPAYPATPSAEPSRLVITFAYPPPAQSLDAASKWSGQKVNWIMAPTYNDPFLVRGRQLDGSLLLRFGRGLVPATDLRLQGSRDHPSTVRLRAPGCYAFQVDGFGFSRLTVFEARVQPEGS